MRFVADCFFISKLTRNKNKLLSSLWFDESSEIYENIINEFETEMLQHHQPDGFVRFFSLKENYCQQAPWQVYSSAFIFLFFFSHFKKKTVTALYSQR